MITVSCPGCKHALEVHGDHAEIHSLVGAGSEFASSGYHCYNCGGDAVSCLTAQVSAAALRELIITRVNPQEAYAALNGFGVPAERVCCEDVVDPLFSSVGLTVKGGRVPNTLLYRVEEITFPNGDTMFLAPSPLGVVIHRVRKRHSYAETLEKTDG